jgi:steroid 5-alpha reductase family enzyme
MSGTALAAWAWNLAITAGCALAFMVVVFCIGLALGKHRVVDVAWGIAFTIVAVVSYVLSAGHGDPARRALVTVLTVTWGLRLAAHIAWRGRGTPEDPRYEKLLAKARGSRTWYALTRVYLGQGALVWFISMPVQAVAFGEGPLGITAVLGTALLAVGLFFESVGDWQLARFKSDPANRGRLMRTGLWRYTRHPNYFGDACVWWGLFVLGADQWAVLCTILSPLLMTWLLTEGSGKRLTEKYMIENRPDYADYAAHTSGFIPLPPR